jgi:hypothetical protein
MNWDAIGAIAETLGAIGGDRVVGVSGDADSA